MEVTIKELLKAYKRELNIEEKIKHNDYEGVVQAFMLRRIILVDHDLTTREFNQMMKHEAFIYSIQDKVLAQYPQLRTTLEEVRLKMFEYQLQKVA